MTLLRRASVVGMCALLYTCLLGTGTAAHATPSTVWLCRPGLADNPCTPDLTTTLYNTQGRAVRVKTIRLAKETNVDCFYVYPTVSNQPTPQATFAIDPELRSIALYQAAR